MSCSFRTALWNWTEAKEIDAGLKAWRFFLVGVDRCASRLFRLCGGRFGRKRPISWIPAARPATELSDPYKGRLPAGADPGKPPPFRRQGSSKARRGIPFPAKPNKTGKKSAPRHTSETIFNSSEKLAKGSYGISIPQRPEYGRGTRRTGWLQAMQRGSNGWMGALPGMALAAGSADRLRPPPPGSRASEHVISQRPNFVIRAGQRGVRLGGQ